MEQQVIGLDVSKAWLDGYLANSGRRLRVGNDAAGIQELVRTLGDGAGCLVVMAASGGYERIAHRQLLAQGLLAAIGNPKRVRDFARGMGLEAKTDRVDAKVIARYGAVRQPAPTPAADPARTELGEILACRRQLIDEITVRQQQLELAKLLRQQIQADQALAADFALLTSMPGCGPILAATLLALMPELGALDRRKAAALAGLAPVAKDSGLRENKRVIKGGRGQVRRALDMAAIASLRIKASPFKTRYDRLIARGKPPKLALTALMRTMRVTLNAMLKTRQPWKTSDEA
jgi:transposase